MAFLRRVWRWIAAAAGVVLAVFLLFGRKRRPTPVPGPGPVVEPTVEGAKKAVAESEKVVAEEEAKLADREERAKELAERLGKLGLGTILLVALVALGLVFGAAAGPAAFAQGSQGSQGSQGQPSAAPQASQASQPPTDYDTLLRNYLEVIDIAREYKKLYEEAETSNKTLLAQVKALQDQVRELLSLIDKLKAWIDQQQEMILKLLRPAVNILGGLGLDLGSGSTAYKPFVGVSFAFR